MFHDLLTIQLSFKQFTDFNGVFSGFYSKKLFLCIRETSQKPKTVKITSLVEAQPMQLKHRASPRPVKAVALLM